MLEGNVGLKIVHRYQQLNDLNVLEKVQYHTPYIAVYATIYELCRPCEMKLPVLC